MNPTKITQASTLALVRKKLPLARRVIIDTKTKARRKRVKAVTLEPLQLSSQFNAL